MKTPIFDFVKGYADGGTARFHMPGHKGRPLLGIEEYDITEIKGADALYSADGIIEESERGAAEFFGTAHTYYSAEGSTLAIKAMLSIALGGVKRDTPPVVLAARNVHRAFVSAAALLDFEIRWLMGSASHLCECKVTAEEVERALSSMPCPPSAVYLTSPDYLGNIADIKGIAEVCDKFSVPLLVDNAHGAYLAFLEPSAHPIALGAAMCADSAHKTLPTLTGGAYLHISKKFGCLTECAREHLALFASTSPSYLILSSLDLTNKYLSDGYKERLAECVGRVAEIKERYGLRTDLEPLKLVIDAPVADRLRAHGIECEFSDGEVTVLMITPENTERDFERLEAALAALGTLPERKPEPLELPYPEQTLGVREATFSPHERVKVDEACGRICAALTVSCPPAVPIVVSGERITEAHIRALKRYGVGEISAVK